jgi:hypothetical protein
MVARSTTQGTPVHDDTSRRELNLDRRVGARIPIAECADVLGGDVRTVLGPQQVLEQDLQAVGKALGAFHLIQAEHLVRGIAHLQRVSSAEAVLAGRCGHV